MRYLFLVFMHVCLFSGSLFGQVKDSIWDRYNQEFNNLAETGKYQEALEVMSKGKEYWESKNSNDPRLGLAYFNIGYLNFMMHNLQDAYSAEKNALDNYLNYYKTENYNTAETRAAIGTICYFLNNLDEAANECKKADEIFKKLKITKNIKALDNLSTLSNIAFKNNDNDKAIKYMKEVIDITLKDFGESFGKLSYYYRQLGFIQDSEGAYLESESSLLMALKYAENKNNKTDILLAYYYLGTLYDDMGKNNLSKRYLLSSLLLFDSSNIDPSTRKINELNIYNKLGAIYRKGNKLDSALFFLNKGETLIDNMDKKDLFTMGLLYDELGKIYLNLNKPGRASYYFQKSVSMFSDDLPKVKRQKAETYIHLAHLYEKKKDKDSINYYYSMAEKIMGILNYREYREFVLLTNKADSLYSNGNFNKAITDYKKALEHGLKVFSGNNDEIATTYYRLGLNLGKEKKYHEAIDYMWKAHNMWEGLTDSRNPGCMKALNYLYDFYYELGEKEKANEVEQRIKVIAEIEK